MSKPYEVSTIGSEEQATAPLSLSELRAMIREIVNEEIDRRTWETFKASYPPEFVQALLPRLQKLFPSLKLD